MDRKKKKNYVKTEFYLTGWDYEIELLIISDFL